MIRHLQKFLPTPGALIQRIPAQTLIQFMPFADAATEQLPLSRLIRLSMFQVSVGMTMVLLTGTLNRVMIVELGVPAALVAIMVSLPLVLAPVRALIGYRSDEHSSFLGWKRVPYIWFGAMLTFGGLAIMPMALLNVDGTGQAPVWVGYIAAGLAFLLAGGGVHMSQTAGLALAADLSTEETRPRVVALLYVMLLVGMLISALLLGRLLIDVTPKSLIQIIQGTAVAVIILNQIALWKQEPLNPVATAPDRARPTFWQAWSAYRDDRRPYRLLAAVGLGAAGFGMQDVLLEPYGAEVLGLSVAATTALTALLAGGSLIGFALAARALSRGSSAYRLAGFGVLIGVVAFSAVIFSNPLQSLIVFQIGTLLIGLGGGLFAVGTLMAAMVQAGEDRMGLALGAWGAVQALATGLAMAIGGGVRDGVAMLSAQGTFGTGVDQPALGYTTVYHIEILLLIAALIAIGPLVRHVRRDEERKTIARFGLTEMPG